MLTHSVCLSSFIARLIVYTFKIQGYIVEIKGQRISGFSDDFSHVCHRRIYPGTVVVLLGVLLLKLQLKQFKRLYIKIKNEKYV